MMSYAITAGVTLLVVIIASAVLEILRRRGFDPVRALSRPFDPAAPTLPTSAETATAGASA